VPEKIFNTTTTTTCKNIGSIQGGGVVVVVGGGPARALSTTPVVRADTVGAAWAEELALHARKVAHPLESFLHEEGGALWNWHSALAHLPSRRKRRREPGLDASVRPTQPARPCPSRREHSLVAPEGELPGSGLVRCHLGGVSQPTTAPFAGVVRGGGGGGGGDGLMVV